MSENRKTIKDIADIARCFITDVKSDVRMQYETFGVSYKITRCGLADFPYVLELHKSANLKGMATLYRGTAPRARGERLVFKIAILGDKDLVKHNTNIAELRKLIKYAQMRIDDKLCIADNTKLLSEKLQVLAKKSR